MPTGATAGVHPWRSRKDYTEPGLTPWLPGRHSTGQAMPCHGVAVVKMIQVVAVVQSISMPFPFTFHLALAFAFALAPGRVFGLLL